MASINYGKKEPKYCKDCKHYTYTNCYAPQNMGHALINGVADAVKKPYNLRDDNKLCGEEGNWWEMCEKTI